MVAGNLIAKLQLVFGNLGLNIPATRTIPYLQGSMELNGVEELYCISEVYTDMPNIGGLLLCFVFAACLKCPELFVCDTQRGSKYPPLSAGREWQAGTFTGDTGGPLGWE